MQHTFSKFADGTCLSVNDGYRVSGPDAFAFRVEPFVGVYRTFPRGTPRPQILVEMHKALSAKVSQA